MTKMETAAKQVVPQIRTWFQMTMVSPPKGDRGAATPLVVALVVIAAALGIGLVSSADALVEAQRASSTADVVALAEVTGGSNASDAVAAANDSTVTQRRVDGAVVVVTVTRGSARASAAATGQRR